MERGRSSKATQQCTQERSSTQNLPAIGVVSDGIPQEPQPGPSRIMTPFHSVYASPSDNRMALTPVNRLSKIPIPVIPSSKSSTISARDKRRSISCDSLFRMSTPDFSNAVPLKSSKSLSKSSERMGTATKRFFHGGPSAWGKTISKPDQGKQHEMAKFVIKFMTEHQPPMRTPHLQELTTPSSITTAHFFEMVKFVAGFIVGEDFFVNGKDAEKAVELGKLLNYPGQLSKSNLITPSAQHAWPAHLTFLAWLCCRVQAILEPENDQRHTLDLTNASGFRKVKFEVLCSVFPHQCAIGLEQLPREVVEGGLELFKEKLHQHFAIDGNKTTEEWIREKEKLMGQLGGLKNETSPTAEAKNRLIAFQKCYESLQESILEAQKKREKFSVINPFLIEKQDLEIHIANKLRQIKKLEQRVKSQPLNHETAGLVKQEIEEYKRQVLPLVEQNEMLKLQVDKDAQEFENIKSMFVDASKQFYIVHRYNDAILSLNLEQFTIDPNPFSPKELQDWIKVASGLIADAQKAVKELRKNIAPISKKQKEAAEEVVKLQKQIEDCQEMIKSEEGELSFVSHEEEMKYNEMLQKVVILKNEEKADAEELEQVLQNQRIWKEHVAKGKILLEKWTQTLAQERDKLKVELVKFKLEDTELAQYVDNLYLSIVRQQQAFYQQAVGVDILESGNVDENMNDVE
ncbi:Kinetochore protein NDC80 [Orchesella cincta]|uniref:Kinetochore protein NDC80 n=1 Tax=Orchesella cincta TaxID=48709 RepID=A0A1D2NLU2_ORCCI|nr:Kinetochore protein NDC80 [Orchesella cincta]